jgi:integrase
MFDKEERKIRYRGDVRVEEVNKRYDVLTSHSMRHGYSKLLSNSGIKLDDVGKLMNQQSSDTIRSHYFHLDHSRILLDAFKILDNLEKTTTSTSE